MRRRLAAALATVLVPVLAAVLALCGAAQAAAPPASVKVEPVAMITDLAGAVLVKNGEGTGPADLLMSLPAGAMLTVPGTAKVTLVYYGSAKEYSFSGPDSVTIHADKPSSITGSEADARTLAALANHSINAAEVQQLVQAGLQMRSVDLRKRIQLRAPVATVVTDATPVFSWSALEPDVQYRFSLRDDAGLTLLSTLQTRTRIRLPAELNLKPGATYSWAVEARARNGAEYSATADFTVATPEQRAALEVLKASVGATPSERLLYAIMLQKLGMQGEAANAWQQLAAERPDSAPIKRIATQAAQAAPAMEE